MSLEYLQKIRQKHPEYNDMPDQTLASKMVAKFPQYQDVLGDIANPQEIKSEPFSVSKTIRNIPSSAKSFGENIVSAVRHPVDTAKALGETALGAADVLIPGKRAYPKADEKFNAVKDFFINRYGGIDNFKKTIQNDPVGFAADLSSVFTGAGGLAKAAGLGETATQLSRVGSFADPINAAVKGVKLAGNVGAEGLGITTGVGGEAVRQVFTNSNPELRNAMRGKISEANIVEDAKSALGDIKEARRAEYIKQLPKAVSNPIKFDAEIGKLKSDLNNKISSFKIKLNNDGTLDFSRSPVSKDGQAIIEEAVNKVRDWGNQPGDFSVEGLDTLKRQLDDLIPKTGSARAFTTSLKSEVRKTLVNNVPEYQKLVSGYEDASNTIKDIESGLSLGGRAGSETIMRKLNQTLKQNFEFRKALVEKLDVAGGDKIISQLAGNQLNSLAPKGLARTSAQVGAGALGGGVAAGGINPGYLGALALSSPRLVGEFLNLVGKPITFGVKAIDEVSRVAPTPIRQAIFQAGRISDTNKNGNLPTLSDSIRKRLSK